MFHSVKLPGAVLNPYGVVFRPVKGCKYRMVEASTDTTNQVRAEAAEAGYRWHTNGDAEELRRE